MTTLLELLGTSGSYAGKTVLRAINEGLAPELDRYRGAYGAEQLLSDLISASDIWEKNSARDEEAFRFSFANKLTPGRSPTYKVRATMTAVGAGDKAQPTIVSLLAPTVKVGGTISPDLVPQVLFTYIGIGEDKVGAGVMKMSPTNSGRGDRVFSLSIAPGNVPITSISLIAENGTRWSTDKSSNAWFLGVSRSEVGNLLNDPLTGKVDFRPSNETVASTIYLFADDGRNSDNPRDEHFDPNKTITARVRFSNGKVVDTNYTFPFVAPASTIDYRGVAGDRVGVGAGEFAPDGDNDVLIRIWLDSYDMPRLMVKNLRFYTDDSNANGVVWETGNTAVPLGVSRSNNDAEPLLNDPGNGTVNFIAGGNDRSFYLHLPVLPAYPFVPEDVAYLELDYGTESQTLMIGIEAPPDPSSTT